MKTKNNNNAEQSAKVCSGTKLVQNLKKKKFFFNKINT